MHRYKKAIQEADVSESDYFLLAKGPTLPNDVFIASSKLEPMLVDEIRARMLENQGRLLQAILSVPASFDLKFKDATLVSANDSDYDMIREVYKAMAGYSKVRCFEKKYDKKMCNTHPHDCPKLFLCTYPHEILATDQ